MLFTACGKDNDENPLQENYAPGEIPGLGEASGELTGTPFNLPEGVELLSEMSGYNFSNGYWQLLEQAGSLNLLVKSDFPKGALVKKAVDNKRNEAQYYYGSGCNLVDLFIPMVNNNEVATTVDFPAGTIMKSKNEKAQNGVLIKKVSITIPAKSEYYLCLRFYCGNAERDSAKPSDIYDLGVVSDAHPIIDLCDRVKNKKINIEEFTRDFNDYVIYTEQTIKLQDIVWRVTDGKGINKADISYIEALPGS